MNGIASLAIAVLATWQIVEIWHHSAVMAGWRARAELWTSGIRGWFANLLSCPFCLSVWTAWVCLILLSLPAWVAGVGLPVGWSEAARALAVFGRLFVWGMAVSRLANLGNDFTHKFCRTPKDNKLPE